MITSKLAGNDDPATNNQDNVGAQGPNQRRRGVLQEAQALLLGFFASLLPGWSRASYT